MSGVDGFVRSATRFAGAVAVGAVTLAAAQALSTNANAQQMQVGGPKPAQTLQDCAKITELAARTACNLVVGTKLNIEATKVAQAKIVEANKVTQQANAEGQCADKVKAGIAEGKFTREALGAVLAGRPAREVGACNILAVLAKS